MLLKKLVLNNFRQYKGKQEIEFSTDPVNNMTIITGDNSQGKTTFVQAFRWLFYEDTEFTRTGSKSSLLNIDVERELRTGDPPATVYVELTIDYRGIEYIFKRSLEYRGQSGFGAKADGRGSSFHILTRDDKGNTVNVNNGTDVASSLFPKGISNYVFFDGEKDITSGKSVESAVNTIMGLDIYPTMIKHCNAIVKKYRTQLVGDTSDTTKINSIGRKIDTLKADNQEKQSRIDGYDKNLEHLNKQIDKYKEIQLNNKQSIEIAKTRDDLEIASQNQSEIVEKSISDLQIKQSNKLIHLMSRNLLDKCEDLLKKEKIEDKGVPNMNADSIRYILSQDKCICGRKHDDESRKYLEDWFDILPPKSLGRMVKETMTFIADNRRAIERIDNEYPGEYQTYFVTQKSILADYNNRLAEAREKLKGISVENVEDKIESSGKQKRQFEDLKKDCEYSIKSNNENIKNLEREIDQLTRQNDANKFTNLRIDYTIEMINRAERIYQSLSKEVKEEFRKTISSVFESMFRVKNQRLINVDDNYNVTLPLISGVTTDTSEGTDVVKNFAFIASLLKMAREHEHDDMDSGMFSEPVPLVMDAPFSKLDATHISNISSNLPILSHQTIITVLEHQWKFASNESKQKVGIRYKLVSESQTYTKIVRE